MDNRYIVALEIGSSKIKGLAASVSGLGDINVIAVEETHVNDCVRYGRIQNVQEVSAHVNDIIRKIENNPRISPRKITDIFVALGGRSLTTVMAQAQTKFPNAIEITNETIERLKREASFGLVTDKKTLEMQPHAFFVDNSEVKNVVGTIGTHIRAEFTTIVISPVNQRNLELIKFEDRNPQCHYIVRPTAIADLVLSSSEKQLGCALVDFGAETSTVTIYKDDVLQSIITLPIGSRNITRDLMSGLSMTEECAEIAKSNIGLAIQSETAMSSSDIEINNYISARAGEIVANILHQIEAAGFKALLPAGIILTGGGARLHNLDRLVEAQSKMAVRIANIEGSLQFKGNSFDRNANIDILAIAKYAAENSDVDCLEQADETTITTYDNEPEYTAPVHKGARRVIDEDSLLEDDSDYTPTDRPAKKIKGNTRRVEIEEPVSDNDFDDNSEEDEDNTIEDSSIPSTITKIKRILADFWTKPIDGEKDDLDSPAN